MSLREKGASPTLSMPLTKIASIHPNPKSSPLPKEMKTAISPKRSSRDASIQPTTSIDETKAIDDFADAQSPRRSSREASIDEAKALVRFADEGPSPRRSSHESAIKTTSSNEEGTPQPQPQLKSCMSAPNLSGMATMKRNVSFHKIEIREYERTLGDNPCVSSGPPIALDWNYNPDHGVYDVEEYEKAKQPRSKAEMLMPKGVREVMLKEYWDVSRSEMNTVAKEINITKRNRRATARSTKATEKRHEQWENTSRKVKRIISLGRNKDEKKLWKDVKAMSTKRIYSANDLAAYNAASIGLDENRRLPVTSSADDSPEFRKQDSVSSSGTEQSATSLPVPSLDDDDWGFGYDEDE